MIQKIIVIFVVEILIQSGNMEYTAIIEKGKNGWYVAQCAQIPAALSQGRTIAEAEENLKDAIRMILECEQEETIKAFNGHDFVRKSIAVL
ncbi:MAG: type II toxin-antitoxin system HicB family antitoxin [Dysgonamonadaceae bacterium]|nr:type II toxin-antitoxin system HicB family antitoxin [Dysgonamonadaceae bacterium]